MNCTHRNKLQWNLNWNLNIFIQENAFENVVCKMAAILSRPLSVKQRNMETWRKWSISPQHWNLFMIYSYSNHRKSSYIIIHWHYIFIQTCSSQNATLGYTNNTFSTAVNCTYKALSSPHILVINTPSSCDHHSDHHQGSQYPVTLPLPADQTRRTTNADAESPVLCFQVLMILLL